MAGEEFAKALGDGTVRAGCEHALLNSPPSDGHISLAHRLAHAALEIMFNFVTVDANQVDGRVTRYSNRLVFTGF